MMRSMFAGVSGLKNHQIRMDVLGNNIANVNTAGFKMSRCTFQDMLSQTLKGGTAPSADGTGGINPAQVGLGMMVGTIDTLHTQGNLGSTGKSTDMAIQGSGFFVLSDGSVTCYSRDGAFDIGQDGDLANPANGYRVQGWTAAGGVIDTTAALGDVNIPLGSSMVASATENIYLNGNLDAAGDVATTGTVAHSSGLHSDGAGTEAVGATLLTALRNSAGTACALVAGDEITINAKKGGVAMAEGSLTIAAATDVDDLLASIAQTLGIFDDGTAAVTIDADGQIVITGNSGTSNAITEIEIDCTGRTVFNTAMTPDSANGFTETAAADGASTSATMIGYDSLGVAHTVNVYYAKTDENTWTWNADCSDSASGGINVGDGTITFTSAGGYSDLTGNISVTLSNGATTPLNIGLDGTAITQFSRDSAISVREQDGYAAGTLDRFSIGSDGIITGIYTNGMTETIAQLSIASFANPAGLLKIGNNLYSTSTNSGVAQTGVAGTGGRGTLSNGVLEMSNVDLAEAFTDMIITQRGFQANAKIITTSDDMLQELVNLKR